MDEPIYQPMEQPAMLEQAEAALRDSEARNAAILEAALDAIITADADGRIVEFNPAAEKIFGYAREHAIGRDMAELIVPVRLRESHRAGLGAAAAGGGGHVIGRRVTMPAIRADGTEFPAELTITRLEVAGLPLFTGHLRDVTERRRAEERIAHLAYHDVLTGLPNRARLEEHLVAALERAARDGTEIALLYVDLDRFKLVNDSFGHAVGDEVLRAASQRMQHALRPGDVLARHGGDEFLVLADLDGDGRQGAEAIADRLLAALRKPFAVSGVEFQIDATIGISLHPEDAATADALMRHADAAMYAGKGAGPVAIYRPGAADSRNRLSMTRRLSHAIENDELALHYQPLVRLDGAEVVGAEALLRWRHPQEGLILPADFLPVAEESGLIEPLGEWVVHELARQASAWRAEGLNPDLAFNVSLRQLRSHRFTAMVADALSAHDLDPRRFVVEITESTMMDGTGRVEQTLADLHEAGLQLAIDDFGSGFSSLGRLQAMPVDILKIDRSFLHRLPESTSAAAVVRTIVQVAAALDMRAVAEGVETEAQRAILTACGCPLAQGYLFGRPVPATELFPPAGR